MNWPLSYSFHKSWAKSDQNTLNWPLVCYNVLRQSVWYGKTGQDLYLCRCVAQYRSIFHKLSLQNSHQIQSFLKAKESPKGFTSLHNEGQTRRQRGNHPPVLRYRCMWMPNQRRRLIDCLLCGWTSHVSCCQSKCKWVVSQRRLDMHQDPYYKQRSHLHNSSW